MRDKRYFDMPEILLNEIKHPSEWITPIHHIRIGSRWTDDTKLGFKLNYDGELDFDIFLNNSGAGSEVIKSFEKAEKEFMEKAHKLLQG